MKASVTVSIVNWNTKDTLERCLRSLRADGAWQGRIVVVDNASSDGSAEMVRARFPDVELIANDHNEGFAAANNRVLGTAQSDYVLILNPDVEVVPGAIADLAGFMDDRPAAAACAPALVGNDGRLQPHLYRRFPNTAQVLLSWTFLSVVTQRIAPLRRRIAEHDIRGTAPIPVDQVPGAAMMVRSSAIARVGLMDPEFFIWFEDVDWCYRARGSGMEIYVLPAIRLPHEGGASFGTWSLQTRLFQFYRAFFRFLCKHRMERLLRIAEPVLIADLHVKELALRVGGMLGRSPRADVRTLAPTRRAIHDVVARYRAGELPGFTSADVPLTDAAPVQPGDTVDPSAPTDVVIVNWNGRRYLPNCLAALRTAHGPVRIIVVDNASTDGSVAWLAAEQPDVEFVALDSNVGYAAAANVGIRRSTAPYVMVMNPDVQLAPEHIATLRERLDGNPRIGVAQGKLYQITPEDFEAMRYDRACTIDSAGHTIARTRMVFDRGQGKADAAEYSVEASVFSACGAALFLRRAMLDDIATGDEYFGEAFFAYKEDIDLGWRARLRGWDVRYVPAAVAYHIRNAPLDMGAWRRMPLVVRRHSWKNHYLLMIRNDSAGDLLRALPYVLGWELLRLGYGVLRDPRVLGGYAAVARELRGALRARRQIRSSQRVHGAEMRRWFGRSSVPVPHSGTDRLHS